MKASIVIPSYNACERLYYNLLSLNMQSYDMEEFEVIVVDDASEDDTRSLLKSFKPSFRLKSIFLKENKGSSYARNCAIEEAEGEIIIFHDSDMIAEKSYVSKHIEAHNNSGTIICGLNWSRIYTFYYKDFRGHLKDNFINQSKENEKMGCLQYNDAQPILGEEDILSSRCFNLAFNLHQYQSVEDIILKTFGNNFEGYHFPWSLFVTNNCSAYKQDIQKAGGFDNAFFHSGCEDVDLGYRMYRNGCSFVKANNIISIHQEHPIYFGGDYEEKIYYFTNKYNSIDLLLFYYGRYIGISGNNANRIMTELKAMEEDAKASWFFELYRKLLMLLRDKNNKAGKDKYLSETKTLRQYVFSHADDVKELLDSMENEKKLLMVTDSFNRLLKGLLGPYGKKL